MERYSSLSRLVSVTIHFVRALGAVPCACVFAVTVLGLVGGALLPRGDTTRRRRARAASFIHALRILDVTVLGLVGGAPAHLGWGGDTARRRFIGGGRGPLLS